jgi:hypothetical protein
MEFGKAFTFAFDDPDWLKKLGIAGLLMIIPILGTLAVAGWALEVTRRLIHHETPLLPDWNNFGDFLMKGLMVWVIGFVYALPIILLSGCIQAVVALIQNNGGGDSMTTVAGILSLCVGLISFVFGLLIAFVVPAAYANYAATGQLGAAFRFGEVFGLVRAAPSAYLMVLLGSILAGLISGLGVIACVIGLFFTAALAMVIQAHLWGQAYNVARPSGAAVPAPTL